MADNSEIIREFKYRKKATAKAIFPWLVVGIIGFLWFASGIDGGTMTPSRFLVCIFMFILGGIAFVRIVYIVREKYRCPQCDEIPMSGGIVIGPGIGFEEGIAINPKRCSHCGTELR